MMKKNLILTCFTHILLILSFHALAQSNLEAPNENMLLNLDKEGQTQLNWVNKPENFSLNEGILKIEALKGTDFFIDPENNKVTATAPFLYKEFTGDFVATALVKPDFKDQWNACALFMMIDDLHWIKFAFENSDATGKSIVSVVTREVSDDANGAILKEAQQIWLKLIRKGNLYAMHWSLDGENYKMCRLASMPKAAKVKIGLEAQCPVGKEASHEFLYFNLESKTVEDLRKGE